MFLLIFLIAAFWALGLLDWIFLPVQAVSPLTQGLIILTAFALSFINLPLFHKPGFAAKVNFTGCLLPLCYGLFLFFKLHIPLKPQATVVACSGLTALLSAKLTKKGIVTNLVPEITVTSLSSLIAFHHYLTLTPYVAFIGGVFGALMGGDLIRLAEAISFEDAKVVYQSKDKAIIEETVFIFGGAGILDGILLTGLISGTACYSLARILLHHGRCLLRLLPLSSFCVW